jgi:ribose transport system permease protein
MANKEIAQTSEGIRSKADSGLTLRRFLNNYSSEFSILLGLIGLCIILAIASPYFLMVRNFLNIGVYISVAGTMAAGLTVTMLMGCMDLSQYSVMAMISVTMGVMLRAGISPWLAIVTALLLGPVIGCFNAFTVTRMKIIPMIATIATQLMVRALAYIITEGQYIIISDPVFKVIGYKNLLGIPILIWVLIIINIVLAYVLKNTSFGRKVYAVGGNAVASNLAGVNVDRMKLIGYVISGFTAGLAAILSTAQVSAAMPTAGSGQEMDCIAAVILGGLSASGGKGRIVGSFIGVLLLAVLMNGMTLLSIDAYYQIFLKGLVLLIAVYVDQLRRMKRTIVR